MSDTLIVLQDTNTIVNEGNSTTIAITSIDTEATVIEKETPILVVNSEDTVSIVSKEVYTIVLEPESITTIVAGFPGPPGMSEDLMVYATQYDFIGDNLIYKGEAVAGSSQSSPVWRIKRMDIVNNDISTIWADGNTNFDNVWSDRLILSYS